MQSAPTKTQLSELKEFIKQNQNSDFRKANFTDPNFIDSLQWKGLEPKKEPVLKLLKAYSRLAKILPKEDPTLIYTLLGAGMHSAIQVASQPRQVFLSEHALLFENQSCTAEDFYDRAQAIRSQLLLKHMRAIS